jgi:hypothetical protein
MERGGVLLRVGREDGCDLHAFVPAEVARRLCDLSSVTPVPGARAPIVGIALAEGAVVTVLSVTPSVDDGGTAKSQGPPRRSYTPGEEWSVPGADRAVICSLGAIEVALTGASVVATGVFEAAPEGEGVVWRDEVVPVLDVRSLYAQAEATALAPKATGLTPALGLRAVTPALGLRAVPRRREGSRP